MEVVGVYVRRASWRLKAPPGAMLEVAGGPDRPRQAGTVGIPPPMVPALLPVPQAQFDPMLNLAKQAVLVKGPHISGGAKRQGKVLLSIPKFQVLHKHTWDGLPLQIRLRGGRTR